MPEDTPPPLEEHGIALVRGSAFFSRLVQLPAELPEREAEEFARITIETLSPFPPAQLAAGWHVFPGTRALLIAAAYRRSFQDAELDAWEKAEAVLPDFAPALCLKPATRLNCLVIWKTSESATGLLWPAGAAAPEALASVRRPEDAESDDALAARLLKRLGLRVFPQEIAVWRPSSAATSRDRLGSATTAEVVSGPAPEPAAPAERLCETLDLRPVEFLAAQRAERSRGELLWRILVGLAAGLVLLLMIEVGGAAAVAWNSGRAATNAARQPEVDAVGESEQLARRLEELTELQLRPFEKLTILEEARPDSVQFTRVSSQGLETLIIEAVARNPGDVPVYEGRLAALPAIAKTGTRNQSFRDNTTTFTIEVAFQQGAIPAGEGSTPSPTDAPAPEPVASARADEPAPAAEPAVFQPAAEREAVAPLVGPVAPPVLSPGMPPDLPEGIPPPPTNLPPPPPPGPPPTSP